MKQVPIKEIFDVRYGTNLELNKLEKTSNAKGIPFVSRTAQSNGVSAFVKPIENIAPNPCHTLSVSGGGSVLETFYQIKSYYSGRDLYYLQPISNLDEKEMILYCSFIRANKYRYSYGRQANKTLGGILIPHPDEVRKIAKKINVPPKPSNKPFEQIKLSLKIGEWKDFAIDKIFNIKKGKRLTQADIKEGNTPFIGSIDSNNGYREYIDRLPNHKGNTITINYNGSVAEAFYQPTPFWASDDVNVLYPKFNMNSYIGLFVISLIKLEKFRFSYGRKWHVGRMNESTIRLPVTGTGNPDWKFIENYIKALPYSRNLKDAK